MLAKCYEELSKIVPSHKESLEAAQCVEQHRLVWRPPSVHTVLLAESHVLTDDSELQMMRGCSQATTHRRLHQTFARFVYCLGYGEHEFAGPALPSASGTSQFWKIFASCVRTPGPEAFAPLQKGTNPSFAARIQAKLSVLEAMHKLGVWLVDASPVALSTGSERVHPKNDPKVLKCSWQHYSKKLVEDAKPHSIVVVGKGVERALRAELSTLQGVEIHAVAQPQGCRKQGAFEEVLATVHRVCQAAAAARGALGSGDKVAAAHQL